MVSKDAAFASEREFRSTFHEFGYQMKPGVDYGLDYFHLVDGDIVEMARQLGSYGGLISEG